MLKRELGSTVRIVGIDRDPAAAANADAMGVELVAGDFGDLEALLDRAGIDAISGILFDFGVSSHQLDQPARGFSYRHDGPLDMRMDTSQPLARTPSSMGGTAGIWPGSFSVSVRIPTPIESPEPSSPPARSQARSSWRTSWRKHSPPRSAADPVIRPVGHSRPSGSPSTVSSNRSSRASKPESIAFSRRDGSLPFRITRWKTGSSSAASPPVREGCTCPPDLPVCSCGNEAELTVLTRKPIEPSQAELEQNPRARSARLRAAMKAAA